MAGAIAIPEYTDFNFLHLYTNSSPNLNEYFFDMISFYFFLGYF